MATVTITRTCTVVNTAGTHYHEEVSLSLNGYSVVGNAYFDGQFGNTDCWLIDVTPVQGNSTVVVYTPQSILPQGNWGVRIEVWDIQANGSVAEKLKTYDSAKPCG